MIFFDISYINKYKFSPHEMLNVYDITKIITLSHTVKISSMLHFTFTRFFKPPSLRHKKITAAQYIDENLGWTTSLITIYTYITYELGLKTYPSHRQRSSST